MISQSHQKEMPYQYKQTKRVPQNAEGRLTDQSHLLNAGETDFGSDMNVGSVLQGT